jgi:hypothetical protein
MLLIQVIVLVRNHLLFSLDFLFQLNIDMDCDGLKKALLVDTDGSLVGQPSSIISQAEYLWGN